MLQVSRTAIPDVKVIQPVRLADDRGFFSETFNRRSFREHGIDIEWVQDNQVYSDARGTLRGLHYQVRPAAQAKLVRVLRGSVYDVAVDIRRGSPTFGRHVGVLLSASAWNQILIPEGFAHGYCTLEPCTEVFYKVSRHYSAEHERGILWSDPYLGIEWPIEQEELRLSPKDRDLPHLDERTELFGQ
jgi:dTDP-4-dehydrorhamnose 3,5-epimerase